ncbi:DUF2115 family protein [Methanobrevibacter sp.]|uniref:DUF2115 family protein n=1 Tax=Methanobrevibacter sp. TaxID=66852 RepID=UPI00388F3E87
MKASELLETIREELEDYPIEYLRNKVTDDRYKDPLVKKLAKYNCESYDEIYSLQITDDFDIKDGVIENLKNDIDYYFDTYAGGDIETREFTKYLSLYLALIAKKPLHPFTENKKDQVYILDDKYYCKQRIISIRDKQSLCRYCVCQNESYFGMF